MVSLICDDDDNVGDKNSDGDENDDDNDVGDEKDNDEKDDNDNDVSDEKDDNDNNNGISGFCFKDAIGARQQLLGHRRRSYVIPLP